MAILFSDFIYKARCRYAIFHTPIFNRIIQMNNVNPQLPPLLVKKTGNVFYVYTYQAEWIPKTFDENGNAIGGIATNNKRSMVGKILDGKNEGPIKFNDKFLKDYPEFKDYIVSRKGKGSYDIKHINDFSKDNNQDADIINTLVASKDYSINDSGKLIESANGVPFSTDPAKLIELCKDSIDQPVLEQAPKTRDDYVANKSAGSILAIMDEAKHIGILEALEYAYKKAGYKGKQVKRKAKASVTLMAYFIHDGSANLEGFEKFAKEYITPGVSTTSRSSAFKILSEVDQKFVENFSKKFLSIFIEREQAEESSEANPLLKRFKGLLFAIDGTSIDHSNDTLAHIDLGLGKDKTIKSIMNLQVVSSIGFGRSIPLFYMPFNGNCNDVSAFSTLISKIAKMGVLLDGSTYVIDKGYDSKTNVESVLSQNKNAIFNLRIAKGSDAQRYVDMAIADNIVASNYLKDAGEYIQCKSFEATINMDPNKVQNKRARNNHSVSVKYHVYFNYDIYYETHRKTRQRFDCLKSSAMTGKELSESDKKFLSAISNFDDLNKDSFSPASLEVDIVKLNNHLKYAGFRVLLSLDANKSAVEVFLSYKIRPQVEGHISVFKNSNSGNSLHAHTNEGFESKLFYVFYSSVIQISMSNKIKALLKQGISAYVDTFRSFKSVLNTLSCIRLEQYKSGVVFEPIVGKQASVIKTMGISLPNSMMSLTKEYEYVECPEDSVNAEEDKEIDEYLLA